MKFYSESLNQLFDTEQALKTAESDAAIKRAEVSKSKKALAERVEASENSLKKAYKEFELAKKHSQELIDETAKKVAELMEEANNKIKEAEKVRRDAIKTFTDKFGSYTKTYSGKDADEEFERLLDTLKCMNPFSFLF